ncbi:MAG: export ABC transporter ATP-binding protein [Flavobacteriaceae bacterium]|nr:MAG: export ABC transporter ATP-binding protein [Flavobacteriaceae bacterium]
MIQFQEVSLAYGARQVFENVNLTIPKGAVFGLLGPNGAGKSTMMHLLSGLLQASSGSVVVNGMNMSHHKLKAQQLIGFVPQEIALYEEFSAVENLRFFGSLYGIKGKTLEGRISELMASIGLESRKDDVLKTYSGGMKRRVNIAAALLHNPSVVLMDEPTVGIDPQSRNRIFEIIEKLHQQGVTVLYSTHYMEEVERLCSQIAIMDKGKILIQGTLDDLLKSGKKTHQICISFQETITDFKLKLPVTHHWNKEVLVLNCNKDEALTAVLNTLNSLGLEIANIDFSQPNLEQLFMELTGTNLRD